MVKVNINDNIAKLIKYGVSGSNRDIGNSCLVTTLKQVVQYPEEVTFQKLFAKNDQLFSLTFSGAARVEGMRWMRFREMEQNCGYGLNPRQWDSVIFIPKRDILFLGFGMFVTFKNDDVKLKIQWRLGKDGADY